MSQLLSIRWVARDPRLVHGRRADRPVPRRCAYTDRREGPLWCVAARPDVPRKG
jgi:hypothetical protein